MAFPPDHANRTGGLDVGLCILIILMVTFSIVGLIYTGALGERDESTGSTVATTNSPPPPPAAPSPR